MTLLNQRLTGSLYQVRLKAMCIVEAVLRQGDSNDVCQRLARMFEEDCGSIVENAQSPQASLKEKSKKVCCTMNPHHFLQVSKHPSAQYQFFDQSS